MKYNVDTIELRKAMIENGYITVGSFAEAAKVDRNTIGGILSKKVRPSAIVIEKIASTLKLSGSDIGRIFFSS